MPCPSHKPYDPMTIIRPNAKPALWWLFPWSYARTLHKAANALRALSDRQESLLAGNYTTRPRYTIYPQTFEGVTRYYFHDTDPAYQRGYEVTAKNSGICLLYDGLTKAFVWEDDAGKAISKLSELNKIK